MELSTRIREEIEYSEGGILSKVVEKDGYNVTLFCMSSGTEIEEHTSTKQGIVYVIEGRGKFILEGEDIEMEEGVLIRVPADAVHELKAKENTSFLLILS